MKIIKIFILVVLFSFTPLIYAATSLESRYNQILQRSFNDVENLDYDQILRASNFLSDLLFLGLNKTIKIKLAVLNFQIKEKIYLVTNFFLIFESTVALDSIAIKKH